jgi:lipoprotein-releasing system permease protein
MIKLSIIATTISVAAMIVTLGFVNGFQKTISQKIFSFWGNIRVQQYSLDKSLVAEETVINKNDTVYSLLKKNPEVLSVQTFATQSAVLEKKHEIEGVLIKGIDRDFNTTLFSRFLTKGRCIQFTDSFYSKEIIISEVFAKLLKIDEGDSLHVYFINNNNAGTVRRSLKVVGIYKTGLEEYDMQFVLTDINLIRRVNNWDANKIGGYEIALKDYNKIDTVSTMLNAALPSLWVSKSIKDVYPNIFDWLGVQDLNRNIVIIIMSIVSIINLITCLLILILERNKMIGILKSIGANNWKIQEIFLYNALFISVIGIGIGLIAGLGICFIQQHFGIIKLPEDFYAVSKIEVDLVWWQVVLVAVGTMVMCFLSLIIPTFFIKYIDPIKSLRFK